MQQKVMLGDVEVTRIGLGTNRLRKTPGNIAFIKAAVATGVQMIDTAYLYTGGESEQTIGTALAPKPIDTVVATKGGFGGAGRGRPEVLRAEFAESVRRLGTRKIDLYYLHRVDPRTPLEESLGVLKELQASGRIGLAGISDVNVEQIERARKVLPIAAVQNRYNLSYRRHDDEVDYCTREGIVFVPFYPLQAEMGPALRDVARRHRATAEQIMLAWLLRRSPSILPIPGTLSLEHLQHNLRALNIELSDAEFGSLT
jgi:aryl-alcohol dehydrogenase-like predicted oxidoreductase